MACPHGGMIVQHVPLVLFLHLLNILSSFILLFVCLFTKRVFMILLPFNIMLRSKSNEVDKAWPEFTIECR